MKAIKHILLAQQNGGILHNKVILEIAFIPRWPLIHAHKYYIKKKKQ